MKIREANLNDSEGIKNLHLQAFDISEAEQVSDLAVDLLHDKSSVNIISLVAVDDDAIIGHVAFSPVFLDGTGEHFGYILAPLAVLPANQHNSVGSALVQHGLDIISSTGGYLVFVYGDPAYYSRFGFNAELAQRFTPPYKLQYPEGWHAMKLGSAALPDVDDAASDEITGGALKCVDSLNDAALW